jgi:hypothetical protein
MPNENSQSTSQTQNAKQKKNFKALIGTGLMIFFDVVLPIVLYYILKKYMREIWALVISGVPPFIVFLYGIARNRRVDILGVIIILSFIVSAIMAVLRDDPRLYLLRESVITATVSLVFLITLIPIKIGSFQMRPLVFYFAKDMATGGTFGHYSDSNILPGLTEDEPIAERFDRYWNSYPMFRHGFMVLTAVWGFGLLLEVPMRVIIVFKAKSTEQSFLLSNIVTYSWLSLLIAFNIYYSGRMKKKGEKRMAAAAVAAATQNNQSNQNNQNNENNQINQINENNQNNQNNKSKDSQDNQNDQNN